LDNTRKLAETVHKREVKENAVTLCSYLACIWYVGILIHRSEFAASCYTESYHHLSYFYREKELII